MSEPKQSNFEGWAVVDLFGHTRRIGYVTTEAYGSAVLFRIDTPELPEREYTLTEPEYASEADGGARWCMPGTKVKRAFQPAETKLVGPAAIYEISPCTEATARVAIEKAIRRPLILLELPKQVKELPVSLPGEPEREEEEEEAPRY